MQSRTSNLLLTSVQSTQSCDGLEGHSCGPALLSDPDYPVAAPTGTLDKGPQLSTTVIRKAGIKRPVTEEDKDWVRASLSQLGRFTGMRWILSPEIPQACDWGILHEPRAKQQYTERTGVVIQERGLFLSDSGLLSGSPDGTVSDDCIIEVKCPWSARAKTIPQAAESRDFFLGLDGETGTLTLKQLHNY
eukprot:superscaffoldBa00000650_g6304